MKIYTVSYDTFGGLYTKHVEGVKATSHVQAWEKSGAPVHNLTATNDKKRNQKLFVNAGEIIGTVTENK